MTDTTAPAPAPASTRGVLNSLPAARLTVLVLLSLVLVAVGVFPQLTARLGGDEYLLRVTPVDPIDPFRGAYVALDYPDLPLRSDDADSDRVEGTVFIPLRRNGQAWVGGQPVTEAPDDGPYLRCADQVFRIECGIGSLFLPQDKAAETERQVRNGDMVAVVRIDSRGHAAVIELRRAG